MSTCCLSPWSYEDTIPQHAVQVTSETGRLRRVIIGRADTLTLQFDANSMINEAIKDTVSSGAIPPRRAFEQDIEEFISVLLDHGVQVDQPIKDDSLFYQLFTRDIGFVIGGTFFVASMAKPVRQSEVRAIQPILSQFNSVVRIPAGIRVEGGDIVVHNKTVYIGLSERTTAAAADYLEKVLPDWKVLRVPLRPPSPGQEALHLDCAFVPVGKRSALIHPDSILGGYDHLMREFDLIPVTNEEQRHLGTNVLSLDSSLVICRVDNHRIINEFGKRGIATIPLSLRNPPLLGGSFRCCSLPLWREP
jgi:N-dimethylarginine dimethylaminohydrolase